MTVLHIVFIFVSLAGAYGVARYRHEHYNKVLAGSWFLLWFIYGSIWESIAAIEGIGVLSSWYFWIWTAVTTGLLYVFSRIGTYAFVFAIGAGVIATLFSLVTFTGQTASLIAIILSGVATYVLRVHVIKVSVGLLMGLYLFLALHLIVFIFSTPLGYMQSLMGFTFLNLLSLALILFAVYFQYGLNEKVFSKANALPPGDGGAQ
ncbi:MAG: hypothetical protein VYA17_03665 [Pseudomonadota bacterium]|nr:hypothetical protein [Pseudomonadota bacterium]